MIFEIPPHEIGNLFVEYSEPSKYWYVMLYREPSPVTVNCYDTEEEAYGFISDIAWINGYRGKFKYAPDDSPINRAEP